MIGKQILNYEIKSLLGEGGMGNVYLAEHTAIGRKVAIKALRPELAHNEEIHKRFKNEASVMAHLSHPNIVGLLDYVEDGQELYLIMEYIEGKGLDEFLKELEQPLTIEEAKNIMLQTLSAFQYAHESNIVHRDVKPSNIFITNSGDVKVLDFGIAKLVGETQFNLTKTGTQVGTVYYMSPEQVKAEDLDHRSDIYSLGITFYELITGFCPYKNLNSEFAVYEEIVRKPLLSLVNTMGEDYRGIWYAISKATSKSKEQRFQSCNEFAEGIKNSDNVAAMVSKKSAKEAITPVKEEKKENKRMVLFILLLLLLVPGLGYFLFKGDKSEVQEGTEIATSSIYGDSIAQIDTTESSLEIENISGNTNDSKNRTETKEKTKMSPPLIYVRSLSGDPIEGALIKISSKGKVVGTVITKADGLCQLDLSKVENKTVTVEASHTRYNSESSIIYYAYGQQFTLNMSKKIDLANEIIEFPDVEASFRGGAAALKQFIRDNVVYPEMAMEMNEQGKVYLSFVVEKDGSLTNIRVERGVSSELDREAKRVVRSMPNWVPGETKGKKVRTKCSLPIVFVIQ